MTPRKLTLKQIPESERPREKLLTHTEFALTDAELLALLMGSGSTAESAVQLAQRLLQESGGLAAVASLSTAELRRVHGIGPAKAAVIKAAFELSHRYSEALQQKSPRFSNSRSVFDYFHRRFRDQRQEEFCVVSLDAKNKLINQHTITRGTLMGSLVHPREVFRAAIRDAAAGILVLHNHPSGDPEPSAEDRKVTNQLSEAAKLIGIPLLDHLIIGNDCYYSFKDQGLL